MKSCSRRSQLSSPRVRVVKLKSGEMREEFFGDRSRALEPLHSLSNAVRAAMPDDGILVAGMTQVGILQPHALPGV